MPLLDHFHAPLHPRRHWESFHSAWASSIADVLNEQLLPEEYFAEEFTHPGTSLEIDVATYEDEEQVGEGVATASRVKVWTPPTAPQVMSAAYPDHFEVLVFHSEGGARVAAAIELVSPGNKDRADKRRAFAVKCASYLVQGIGLIIVDVVTSRRRNLHNEIMSVLEKDAKFRMPDNSYLYAVAYRPVRRKRREEIDFWTMPLSLGAALPSLPLSLAGDLVLELDFEAPYADTCRRRKLS